MPYTTSTWLFKSLVKKLLLSWQKITNSKVEFKSEREFSRVILYLPENGANLGANEAQTVQSGANLGANEIQTAQFGANLGANKQRILHAIQIDNTLSLLKLQVLTNIPLRTLQREVNELIALGVLEKGGTRKKHYLDYKEHIKVTKCRTKW